MYMVKNNSITNASFIQLIGLRRFRTKNRPVEVGPKMAFFG